MSQLDRSIKLATRSFVRDLIRMKSQSHGINHVRLGFAKENRKALLILTEHDLVDKRDIQDVMHLLSYYSDVINHHERAEELDQAAHETNLEILQG